MTQEKLSFSALLIACLLTELRLLFLQVMFKFDKFIDIVTVEEQCSCFSFILLQTEFIYMVKLRPQI